MQTQCRILVVEDNRVNQMVAIELLSGFGLDADLACNGLEAVDACTGDRYDVVLMDCQMPEMDGYEATRMIRGTMGPSCDCIIIAMTGNSMEGDREECMSAGMNDYLTKPLSPEDLAATLSKYIPNLREMELSDEA